MEVKYWRASYREKIGVCVYMYVYAYAFLMKDDIWIAV